MTSTPAIQIPQLRSTFDGQVVAPDDESYDTARRLMLGGFDRRPTAIIKPADAAGVARVVGLARESGAPFAVRSGGHSYAGFGAVDDGIVLDLSGMKQLDIDTESRTAWAQTGLTAGEYTTAAVEHGLATGFGDTASVGIGGITLGGGVGYLSRKYGLTIDDVLAAEVVTADGQILQVDADNHPELFWAIRGGGGNFGVVTRFKYRLHEVPSIVGGMLFLPASAENIAAFVAAADAAPNELSTIANVMTAPPLPFLPAELHGQLVLFAQITYAGPDDAGEEAVAPFRAIAEPLADMVKPMPYTGMFPPVPAVDGPRPGIVTKNLFAERIDLGSGETVMEHLTSSDAPVRVFQIRVLGGAISQVPNDATAYAHRDKKIMANVTSLYFGPDDKPVRQKWVDDFTAAVDQGVGGAYVNFVGDVGPEHARRAYPQPTWERLAAVKAMYDPSNLFRSNHNVLPTS